MEKHFADEYVEENWEQVVRMGRNRPTTIIKHIDQIREFIKRGEPKDNFPEFLKSNSRC